MQAKWSNETIYFAISIFDMNTNMKMCVFSNGLSCLCSVLYCIDLWIVSVCFASQLSRYKLPFTRYAHSFSTNNHRLLPFIIEYDDSVFCQFQCFLYSHFICSIHVIYRIVRSEKKK